MCTLEKKEAVSRDPEVVCKGSRFSPDGTAQCLADVCGRGQGLEGLEWRTESWVT